MKIAVVGATGLVGEELLSILPSSKFAGAEIVAFASAESAGTKLPYNSGELEVRELKGGCFKGMDLAMFAIGDLLSRQFVPEAVDAGCYVVDKSNAYRMQNGVPLLVPGVNDKALGDAKLAANPNCTTIGFVHAIAPLMRFGIEEIVASSYQSLSGAGKDFVHGFLGFAADATSKPQHHYSEELAFVFQANPAIDKLVGDEYLEETKLRLETQKITGLDGNRIYATAVRVAVIIGHCISIHLRLRDKVDDAAVRAALGENPTLNILPVDETPFSGWAVKHRDKVTLGRIRVRPSSQTVDMFAVADNLHIGAALNGLRIAELMIK
jgi:aspartate-semialdehyde dehydrogenase